MKRFRNRQFMITFQSAVAESHVSAVTVLKSDNQNYWTTSLLLSSNAAYELA